MPQSMSDEVFKQAQQRQKTMQPYTGAAKSQEDEEKKKREKAAQLKKAAADKETQAKAQSQATDLGSKALRFLGLSK